MARGRWRERVRGRASRAAHATGRRRPVLQGAYGALVAAETLAASAWAGRRAVGPVDPGTLTVVVKTFERPAVLRRMLASVRRVFAGPVVVADDSREPVVPDDPATTVLRLPFDSGVGAGRNALLAAVSTPYVLMADDDMAVLPDFDVRRMVAYLDRNPGVDVVGGRVVHLPLWRTADYSGAALYAYRGEPRARQGTVVDGLPVAYKVPNFYVARTGAVRSVGYDDRLKRVDHNDFFTAAYGRLVCVVDPAMVCLHAHSFFDAHYQSFRMDTAADLALLARKWSGESPGPAPAPAASGTLAPDERAHFHRAALDAVARDLGLSLRHAADGVDVTVAGDAEPLLAVLRTLGWSGSRGRLSHPLWGEARIASGAPSADVPVVDGVVRPDPGSGAGGVRWSPRAAALETPGAILVAALPGGPVLTLTPPGDLLWAALGPETRDADEAIGTVLAAFDEPPPDAAAQLREFLDLLVRQGLVERSLGAI